MVETGDTPTSIPKKPGIRTMRSDASEYFKVAKPSLLDLVSRETSEASAGFEPKKKFGVALAASSGLLLLAAVGTLAYFFLLPARAPVEIKRTLPPAPFFATEASRTITVKGDNREQFLRLMADSFSEKERPGIVKRVLIRMAEGKVERFATFADLIELYQMSPPAGLSSRINPPLMTFFYSGPDGNRFGLAGKIQDPDRVFFDMLSWEMSLFLDMRPLLFGEPPEQALTPFEDRIYRNIDWRYQKLSSSHDLGLGYAIFPAKNLLIITTSKGAMETVINRLFDAP